MNNFMHCMSKKFECINQARSNYYRIDAFLSTCIFYSEKFHLELMMGPRSFSALKLRFL